MYIFITIIYLYFIWTSLSLTFSWIMWCVCVCGLLASLPCGKIECLHFFWLCVWCAALLVRGKVCSSDHFKCASHSVVAVVALWLQIQLRNRTRIVRTKCFRKYPTTNSDFLVLLSFEWIKINLLGSWAEPEISETSYSGHLKAI